MKPMILFETGKPPEKPITMTVVNSKGQSKLYEFRRDETRHGMPVCTTGGKYHGKTLFYIIQAAKRAGMTVI